MNKLSKIIVFLFIAIDVYLLGKILLGGKNIQIFNPQGLIAYQERNLFVIVVALMLLVVIPVFILAIHVATRYYEDNKKAKFDPEWQNGKLQFFFWTFPTFIILVLCVINWISAHQLDPHNTLTSDTKPLTVQVVALPWKWLFIYPEQNIATVNYLVIPEKTPINFELTASDTPMNSFWIPQLGSQIYAMAGMSTQLHLIADTTGVFRGSNAEINGEGFADMTFTTKSVTPNDFNSWVASTKQSPHTLTLDTFNKIAQPSEAVPPEYFSSAADNLYTTRVMKYMARPGTNEHMSSETMQRMEGM